MSKEKIHILGICGTFMGSLALLAREKNYQVSGCDENVYPPMSELLINKGVDLIEGYDVKDLPKADTYIIGNALSRGNPVVEHLLDGNKTIVSGPEWISKNILAERKVLAISGTHGKTTVTSISAWILDYMEIDAGFLIAGKPKNFELSARIGSHEIFVIEADEYDTAFFDKRAKFIHYKPEVLVVNNIEFDHSDIYQDIESIQTQFHHLIRTIPSEGKIIFPDDDPNIEGSLSKGCWSKKIPYGDKLTSDWKMKTIQDDFSAFEVIHKGISNKVSWDLIGEHNSQNAMASIIACYELGVRVEDSCEALSKFRGVSRRLDLIYEDNNVKIFDDFAHHPTAIKKTITGLKFKFPNSRILALIELRSNTMKSGLHDLALKESTLDADKIFWKSKDQEQEKKLIKIDSTKSHRIRDDDQFIDEFIKELKQGDVVVLMSNGNFLSLGKRILNKLN